MWRINSFKEVIHLVLGPVNVSYVHLISLFRCKFSIKYVELFWDGSRTCPNRRKKCLLYHNIGRISWSINYWKHRKHQRNARRYIKCEQANCTKSCFKIFSRAGMKKHYCAQTNPRLYEMNGSSDQGEPTVFDGLLNATLHVTASVFHMQVGSHGLEGVHTH